MSAAGRFSWVSDQAEQTSDDARVTVYWRPGCGVCALLDRGLAAAGLDYERRNIWDDSEAAEFVRKVNNGNETVPTVVIGTDVYTAPPARFVLEQVGIDPPEGPFTRLLRRGPGRRRP